MKKITTKKKTTTATFSKIKNSDLVKEKHLLIAKKAAKLFIKKGYPDTTIREISKETGLAMGNLYDYISKKEDVLCLVFDVYHQTVEDASYGPDIISIDDPVEQLSTFIRVSLNNVHEFHDEILLMYRESRLLPKKHLELAKEKERTQIRQTEVILRKGIKKGVFKVQDTYFSACMIFYHLTLPILRGWMFKGKYSKKKVDRLVEDYILKNILAPEHFSHFTARQRRT